MANKDYDDISEILFDLQDNISSSMSSGSVDKRIKSVYKEKVDKMYDSYDRKYYEPRYNKDGGFGDEDNWNSYVNVKQNGFEYVLENDTKGSTDNYGQNIDQIIETGIGYTWSDYPNKRPVYEWTQGEVDSSNIIDTALEKDLKKNGWDFE